MRQGLKAKARKRNIYTSYERRVAGNPLADLPLQGVKGYLLSLLQRQLDALGWQEEEPVPWTRE